MRKLKLESLQVESFETTGPARAARGTVAGHQVVGTGTGGDTGGTAVSYCMVCEPWSADYRCDPQTYDMRNCGETNPQFDCTYGCTYACSDPRNSCGDVCWIDPDQTVNCQVG
ncbi:MAG TPA: hypothetical protein VGC13_25020 [Longimicrobium sp.]|jgi:hypothetical protein|uniref:hypothetical protein n=1 Tax=Longimicrobium sp. TaxID=2029185 RepID=UPI002EDB757D